MTRAPMPPQPQFYAWSDDDERDESFSMYMEKANEYRVEVTDHTEDTFGGYWKLPPRQRFAICQANEPVLEWITRKAVDGPTTPQVRQQVAMEILQGVDPSQLPPEALQQLGMLVEQDPRVIESRLSMYDLDREECAKMMRDYAELQQRYGVAA